MKKRLFAIAAITLTMTTIASAQVVGSTSNATATVGTDLLKLVEAKYAWVTYVLAAIVAIDHALAASKSISASSTFQLITGFLKKIGGTA